MIALHAAALWILSGVAAAVYGIVAASWRSGRLRVAVKLVALGSLAALAWLAGQGWLLAAALTLSAVGVVLTSREAQRWLVPGLLACLIARAAYFAVFARTGGGVLMFRAEPLRLAGVLLIVSAGVLTLRLIWTRLGPLLGPACIYALAGVGMTLSALALPLGRWPAMVGAAVFLGSDALSAFRAFGDDRRKRWAPDWAVWSLQYAGQALIAWAFVPMVSL